MNRVRIRQILRAEAIFSFREGLARRLADKGIYVFGRITSNPPEATESTDREEDAA